MKNLKQQLAFYQLHHTNKLNKITHFIGIPLLVFAIILLCSWVHIEVPNYFSVTLAWILTVVALIYYFFLDVTFAAVLTIVFVIFNIIAKLVSNNVPSETGFIVFITCFVIGIILQLLGHVFEKKKPALTEDLWQAVIAPMFLTAEAFFYFGYRKELLEKLKDDTK